MLKQACLLLAIPLVVLANGCATIENVAGEDDLKIQDGYIYRGDKSFTVQAVHVPGLFEKGASLEFMVPAMARIAEAGGNAIALDLSDFSEDGRSLDPVSITTVATYAERAKDQRMVLVVRVLGDAEDTAFRKNALETAARMLKGQGMALYWIDGPDAAALAARFKKLAPRLILAAPENGDVQTVTDPNQAGNNSLMLVAGTLPLDPWGDTHYVVPDSEETYARLEAAYTNETERKPWTPDNSMLSEDERNAGFVSLFNGRDLDNWWHYYHGKESFRVSQEGYIECYQAGAGGLVTRDRYENFILRLEYKLNEADANSGIHLWVPRAARQSKNGFEFQIMGDSALKEPHATSTGAIYDVLPALAVATRPEGEWNELEIMLEGSHLKATLNGIVVQDLDMDEIEELRYRLRRGFIDLQDHDDYAAFRNIRIKVLEPANE